VVIFGLASAGARVVLIAMVACCECGFDGASKWHWQMHQWVEQHRCAFRFGCRNIACSSLHTLAEQAHKWTWQRLRQREWEAECGFCSVGLCKFGLACERASRTVAYDSNYEDEEDGWSVVGGDRCSRIRAHAMLSDGQPWGGRFAVLLDTDEGLQRGDETFFDCACDNADFRFEIRNERRIRQQERRTQNGEQRKGRTARKRLEAAAIGTATENAAAMSVSARKRLCWLRAKLRRSVMLWQAVRLEAAACYGAQDGCEWRQLKKEMEVSQAEDERFWQSAVEDLCSDGVMVCFGEQVRLDQSVKLTEVYRTAALDGRKNRFKAEKDAEERKEGRKAGAVLRARQRQVEIKWWARVQQLPEQQRLRMRNDEDYARQMGLHIRDWLEEDAARGATRQ
jgi:hypothetical protein